MVVVVAIVAAAACAWVGVLVATPLLPVPAAGVLYAAGSFICHQIAERSFHIGAFQLPVCGRCLGLYAGGAVGSLIAAIPVVLRARGRAYAYERTARRHAAAGAMPRAWRVTIAAAVPTAATFVLEWGAGWEISNAVRAGAAVPLGAAAAFVVVGAFPTLHYDECAPPRPSAHGHSPATPT